MTRLTEAEKRNQPGLYIENPATGNMVLRSGPTGKLIEKKGLTKNNEEKVNEDEIKTALVVDVKCETIFRPLNKRNNYCRIIESLPRMLIDSLKNTLIKETRPILDYQMEEEEESKISIVDKPDTKIESIDYIELVLDSIADSNGGDKYICPTDKKFTPYIPQGISRKDGKIYKKIYMSVETMDSDLIDITDAKETKKSKESKKSVKKGSTTNIFIATANIEKVGNLYANNVSIKKDIPALSVD